MKMSTLLLLLHLALSAVVLGKEYNIKNESDFISFANSVNEGTSYSTYTVFLDSDITFSDSISSIGTDKNNKFSVVFDGQGYIISNLTIISSTSSSYTGLFGYSTGLIARNVVFDNSCLLTNSYSCASANYFGSIFGYCSSIYNKCTIENSVNMGSITFGTSENEISSLFIGGFAGHISTMTYNTYIENCVNYGSITYSGTSSNIYIGGIIGYSFGDMDSYNAIQNSLNYGTISHTGTTTSMLNFGGISGSNQYTDFYNCLSAGKMIISNPAKNVRKGCIAGSISSGVDIRYCYFTSTTGVSSLYGSLSPDSTTGSTTSSISESTAMRNLNTKITSTNGWTNWFLLHPNGGKINDLDIETLAVTGKYFQKPVKEGNTFQFWCVDAGCTTVYDPSTSDMSRLTNLYACWNYSKYLVSFNATGGYTPMAARVVTFNSTYGDFMMAVKPGHTFLGWFTEAFGGDCVNSSSVVLSAFNHTLYAQWTVRTYTISFESNGGSECSNITEDYGTPVTLHKPNKTGYTFVYWCSDKDLTTEYTYKKMQAKNITLYALWSADEYTVTFDVNGGDQLETSSKKVVFNSTYGPLPTPISNGYNFVGWFDDDNESVTENTLVSIAGDHTLTAQWNETQSNQVEIIFSTGSLTRKEVEDIIRQYTNANFMIIQFENSNNGEITSIIEFADIEDAVKFVRDVRESPTKDSNIKRINYTHEIRNDSFSLLCHPILLSSIFMI